MSDDVVLIERKDPGIAILTLNRPDRLNAWNGELAARYFTLLDECEADSNVKVIVVTGAGRGYCAGADMDTLQGIGASAGSGGGENAAGSRPVYETAQLSKPIIAAINGACAGIGLVQALMCDLRFAASGIKFTTAFSRRGLIAEYGMSWVLPRLVGTANALDLLMSGRVILAEEAKQMGMVNDVLPADQLMNHTLDYAADIATNASPTSMAVIKRQVYADAHRTLPEASDAAVELMKASLKRPDFKEGVASYLAKRPPAFQPINPDA
ncbi:MAG: enoyl-CoA hydratase [Ilumatobacteraceae bacterium]|jgi:enoyl-CoA hydratase/carnithine racemase|nr:enoyl-CoA hydratase [Ilumatobacteraceae bacterium]